MVATIESHTNAQSENGANGEIVLTQERATNAFRVAHSDLDRAVNAATPVQAESLRWFARYIQIRNMNRRQVGGLLQKSDGSNYSTDAIYQTLTGRRGEAGANIEPLIGAIEAFRRTVERPMPRNGFIETDLFCKMSAYFERARKKRRVGMIFGDMNIGKSACFDELCRRDPTIIGFRMPTRGHLNRTLQIMAANMAMGSRQTVHDLSERIIEAIPDDALIAIDEFDQIFNSVRNVLGLTTADFFRELYDRRRCGIILMMDHYGRDAIRPRVSGQKATGDQKRLQRLWRRRIPPLQLPLAPSDGDLTLFAQRAGLDPAPDEIIKVDAVLTDEDGNEVKVRHSDNPLRLQRAVANKDGLGVWIAVLDDAAEMAAEQRRKISWAAVIKAHAMFYNEKDEENGAK
jgi:hypothetical protein